MAKVEEMAGPALFLASDAARSARVWIWWSMVALSAGKNVSPAAITDRGRKCKAGALPPDLTTGYAGIAPRTTATSSVRSENCLKLNITFLYGKLTQRAPSRSVNPSTVKHSTMTATRHISSACLYCLHAKKGLPSKFLVWSGSPRVDRNIVLGHHLSDLRVNLKLESFRHPQLSYPP